MKNAKWALVTSWKKGGQETELAGIYPPAVFHALLRHERCRSDRDASEFSLVVFDVSAMASNDRGVAQVVRHIQDKTRSIDEVGWLDVHSIGVLLPATKVEGGRKFAHRVFESPSGSLPLIPWQVYTYPSHWLPGDNGKADSQGKQRTGGEKGQTTERHFQAIKEGVFSDRIPTWKRCLDIVGALVMIILLSPVLLLLALYIKIVSPGRVLYRQRRVGYRGKLFTFIKFRTMHENNSPEVHRQYLKELIKSDRPMEKLDCGVDCRIIPAGRFVRKACLDELPQLFNVLRGDMSLVGPRPCIPYEAEEYLRWHTRRFDILPGMTGLWQVSGKNKLSFEQMIRLDICYANRMSPLLDLKILLRTAPAILRMVVEASLRRAGMKVVEPSSLKLDEGDEKGLQRNA